jgi:hypothetical protein
MSDLLVAGAALLALLIVGSRLFKLPHTGDPTRERNCDLFISYSSKNAMLARPAADHLFSVGLKPWFAEYQILTERRLEWRDTVVAGLGLATRGVIFQSRAYAKSPECELELEELCRLPPDKLCVVVLEDVQLRHPLPDNVHRIHSTDAAAIATQVAQFFTGAALRPSVTVQGKEPRHIEACTGLPYSLDFGDWVVTSPPPKAFHEHGPEAFLTTPHGSMHLNILHGRLPPNDDAAVELDGSKSATDLYESLLAWSTGFINRHAQKATGVHVVNSTPDITDYAVSYVNDGVLRRKYSVVRRHPLTNHHVEFAFTFLIPRNPLGLTPFSLEMDRLVTSLRWPDTSPAGRADIRRRVGRLREGGRSDHADELEAFLATLDALSREQTEGTELALVRSSIQEARVVFLEYAWREELSWALANELDTRVRIQVTSLIGAAARAGGLTSVRTDDYGRRPAWLFDDMRLPVSLVSAGFDSDERRCWLCIGAITGAPLPAAVLHGLLTGFVQEYEHIRA